MLKLIGKLLFAYLGNAVCERIRPTQTYSWGMYVKAQDNPWRYETGHAGKRRPWQKGPTLKIPVLVVNRDGALRTRVPEIRVDSEPSFAIQRRGGAN